MKSTKINLKKITIKIQKHKEKRKKAKHYGLLLSFTVQYMSEQWFPHTL
jgi:hypothetical protein